MRKDTKGFTLAELLIVVVIIAVLVAIGIPIFSNQLEKSRDAVSISSIRSAYAVAMSDMLTYNGYTGEDGNGTRQNYIPEENGRRIYVNHVGSKYYVSAVWVKVNIKSRKANDWSGLADNLPFILTDNNSATAPAKNLHGDMGKGFSKNKDAYVAFYFDSAGTGNLRYAYIFQTGKS
jgi:prepilin-type N-terminal cleavage/methylation domain-containing protein